MKELWLNKYNIAKKYYEKHGNLDVSRNYTVKIRNEIFNLGVWLNTQRCKYNGTVLPMLCDEQIKLLEEIGMVWDVTEYKKLDKFLEEQYILYEQNMLTKDDIIKLLEDGVFVYSDLESSNKLEKTNTLEYYRKVTRK